MQVQTGNCSQWLLTVELHQFQNTNHVIRTEDAKKCCCDDSPCVTAHICDTQFLIFMSDCLSPPNCSIVTPPSWDTDVVMNLRYTFLFLLDALNDHVRIRMNLFMHKLMHPTLYMYVYLQPFSLIQCLCRTSPLF